MIEKICMIGMGYIGLPTATLFAAKKYQVLGVDVIQAVVDTINQGKIHIVEPELDILVRAAVTEGYLQAAVKPAAADVFLIAVPTPFKAGHKPDLSYIEAAAQSIASLLEKGNLVVLESTSPVGTTESLEQWLAQARPDLSFPSQAGDNSDIHIAYCPERVLPGKVVHELVANDRIIGGLSGRSTVLAIELYKIFVYGNCIATNARTAEMCKLTENSSRDVNIAFANELSIICAELDINVWELIALANRHPRVQILQPGAGVGGHCIAVDPWFIVDKTPAQARLIKTARMVNDSKPQWVFEQVKKELEKLHQRYPDKARNQFNICCLGLSFKPNIDDLRESPALDICVAIAELGLQVNVIEPHITKLPEVLQQAHIHLVQQPFEHCHADIVCILVHHAAFDALQDEITHASVVVDAVGFLGGWPKP